MSSALASKAVAFTAWAGGLMLLGRWDAGPTITHRAADWASFNQRSLVVASPTSRDTPSRRKLPSTIPQHAPSSLLPWGNEVRNSKAQATKSSGALLSAASSMGRTRWEPWQAALRSDGALRLVLRQGCVSGCYGNREETPGLGPARSL